MEFTLVFECSNASRGGNYNLVFEPCPLWAVNGECLINLNPESPLYQYGSVKRLIEHEGLQDVKKCVIVVHKDYGYGVEADLKTIQKEMDELGIKYKVINTGEL